MKKNKHTEGQAMEISSAGTAPQGKNEKKKLSKAGIMKRKKKLHGIVRFVIQLGFLLTFPSAFTAAWAGVKTAMMEIGSNTMVELSSFTMILLGLCAFTVIFGRFFCGYACAFGTMGDWVHRLFAALWKLIFKKNYPGLPHLLGQILNYVKYVVLIGILYLCFQGSYGNYQGTSPWDAFAKLESLLPRLSLHGEDGIAFTLGAWRSDLLTGYTVGAVVLLLILIGMCLQERFFCRFLCPMGAVFSLLPVLPAFTIRRNRETCSEKCKICRTACPAGITIPEHTKPEVLGECFQCQKCALSCPKQNVQIGLLKLKGSGIVLTVIKAGLLVTLMYYLNI